MITDLARAVTITDTYETRPWRHDCGPPWTLRPDRDRPYSYVTVARWRRYAIPHGHAVIVDLTHPGDEEDPYGTGDPIAFYAHTVPVNADTLTMIGAECLPCVMVGHNCYLPVENLLDGRDLDADDLSEPVCFPTLEEAREHLAFVRRRLAQNGLRDESGEEGADTP